MSDTQSENKELKEMVQSLLTKVNSSPVLNGGFTRLQEEVAEVKEMQIRSHADLRYLKVTLTETREKVGEIQGALHNPEKGLFYRVVTIERDGEEAAKSLDELEKDTARHSETSKQLDDRMESVETKLNTLTKVAGEDLEDLRGVVKIKKNLNRAFWAVGLAFLAAFGKAAWDLLVHIERVINSGPPGAG